MTISNTNKFNRPAITTGTSINITDLEIQDEDEIKITRQNADKTEDILTIVTDYTINADLDTVTLLAAIDGVIFIKATATLNMVFNQLEDYQNFDKHNVENVERALDKARLIDKQGSEEADRNIKLIISSALTGLEVDDPTGNGGKIMALKSDLSGFEFLALTNGGLTAVVSDPTPELGGDLETNGSNIIVEEDDLIIFEGATDNAFETTIDVVDPTADRTVSLPNATDTLVGKATTDTLTNKTIDSDGTGNVITNVGSSEIKSELITGQSDTAIAVGDSIIYSDVDDSGNLKKDTVQGILDLAGGGAGLVLISTATASASSEITFTGLNSTYFKYIIELVDVVPATDNVSLRMQTSTNNGSSYDSGASDYLWHETVGKSNTSVLETLASGAIDYIRFGDTIGNLSTEGANGSITIHNPSATNNTSITCDMLHFSNSSDTRRVLVGAARISATDVDAVRLYFNSGNITSGTFKLYGVIAS